MHSQSSPVRCALTDVIVVTHHQHTAGMELKVSSHGRNSFSCLPSTKVQFTCEPSPGADVAAASPVPAQMWQRRAQSRRRCGRVSHWAGRWPHPRSARSSKGCHRPHCIRRPSRTSAWEEGRGEGTSARARTCLATSYGRTSFSILYLPMGAGGGRGDTGTHACACTNAARTRMGVSDRQRSKNAEERSGGSGRGRKRCGRGQPSGRPGSTLCRRLGGRR